MCQSCFVTPQDRTRSSPRRGLGSRLPRWSLPAGIAVLVLCAIGWVGAQWLSGTRSFDADRLRIATVTRGDLLRDISADGRVIAANSPTLYAIAAGTVMLKVVAGDKVTKGQQLAVIDSPELRSRLVQEESTLASLDAGARRAGLDARIARLNARKTLDQAEISHTAAQRDLQRYQTAYEQGAVSQTDFAHAQDDLKKTTLGLSTAREDFELQSAGSELDARNKQLLAERQRAVVTEARRQVDALTLRAPFDGQVGQVQVQQGTSVVANGPVLSVVDLRNFEVEIKVPESFARDLGLGMSAQLTSGTGDPYPGEIAAVSPEVVNGEVTTRIRFSDKQPSGPAPEPAPLGAGADGYAQERSQAGSEVAPTTTACGGVEGFPVRIAAPGWFLNGAPGRQLHQPRRSGADGTSAAEPPEERPRIRIIRQRCGTEAATPAAGLSYRGAGSGPGDERNRAAECPGAVLFHQASWHGPGSGADARNHRGTWRPCFAGEP